MANLDPAPFNGNGVGGKGLGLMPKLADDKPTTILERVLYRLARLPIASANRKLRWLLNIEWAVGHLCHDFFRRVFTEADDPRKSGTLRFVENQISRSDRLLDVGCGNGYMTAVFSRHAASVKGIDISQDMVDVAQHEYGADGIAFEERDASTLTTADLENIDVVVLLHVLGCFEDPEGFLRFLANNVAAVCIEVPDFDSTPLNIVRQRLGLTLMFRDRNYLREFNRDEIKALFEGAQLSVQASEYRHGVQRFWAVSEMSSTG